MAAGSTRSSSQRQSTVHDVEALKGAVIIITMQGDDTPVIRPGAFVFKTAEGMAWVEPSYADPSGAASPALHMRAGQWDGHILNGKGWRVEVLPYEAADVDLVGDSLEWFAGHLKAEGLTWAQERARVQAMIAGEMP